MYSKKPNNRDDFNSDYFERGPESGVSCYSNYRWLAEKTIKVAMTYIDYLGIPRNASVLDFGCAKGYYVKALRILSRDAWGCDVSKYALSQADFDTSPFLVECGEDESPIPFLRKFDYIISKDVLEHLSESQILSFLEDAKTFTPRKMLIIVPLSYKGKYVIPEDEFDVTHKIRKDKNEWIKLLTSTAWELDNFTYRIEGIKDHQSVYKQGVGFFTLALR
jgi:SAM-dependent methyltransferase